MKNWNIIPIRKATKLPAVKWKNYTEKKYIGEILSGQNQAVICGKTSDNLVIIDLDFRNDNKQFYKKILALFIKQQPKLAKTYIEETPHGVHLHYNIKDACPSRRVIQDTSKEKALKTFKRIIVTNFPELLKGVDILGQGGYSLIAPSKTEDGNYKALNNLPILSITERTFENLLKFFIREEQEIGEMRQPFQDILTGKIDIKDQASFANHEEHVYWRYLYIEAFWMLKLNPEDLFELLEKNQPEFDQAKTEIQLQFIDLNNKPLTNNVLYDYFPQYEEKKRTLAKVNDESPLWLRIATTLLNEFDIITMKDTNELMVRKGNIFTYDTIDFYKRLSELILISSYNNLRGNILKYIQDSTKFDRRGFCFDKWTINFKNGYVDIPNKKFVNNSYDSHVFCYEIPHELDITSKAKCPKFKGALTQWLKSLTNVITIDDIFEMMGYTMTMNTNMKMAFFIFGEKNTGKTTFQNIFETLIGKNNRASTSLQRLSKDQFGTDGLEFKILNMVGDMSALKVNDASMFKILTGGDNYVEAEKKGGSKFRFRCIIKIWYNANKIPEITDNDDAFYSRWIMIPFPNSFQLGEKSTITDLSDLICGDEIEMQGIIRECIEGVRRLYKRGYFRQEIIKNSKHIWRYNAEPIYAFLYDNCMKSSEAWVRVNEFKKRFQIYLHKNGHKPMSVQAINAILERFNIYKERILIDGEERSYVYSGIHWKDDAILDNYL